MVLLNSNPLQEVRNTRDIFGVVVNGKYYSRETLDTMLQQVENLAKQP